MIDGETSCASRRGEILKALKHENLHGASQEYKGLNPTENTFDEEDELIKLFCIPFERVEK